MQLTNDQIREIIPHRYPFLLIDRIEDYEAGKWAKAIKCVSSGEQYFVGHFPQKSVMPGVLIIEALAQAGAIAILTEPENRGKLALFGGINKAKFRHQVLPGDVLELECKIIRTCGPVGIGEAAAVVDGKVVCKAELTFAIIDASKEKEEN